MKKSNQTISIRIPQALHQQMLDDLRRPHPFAFERVGFLYAKTKVVADNTVLVLATEYKPVKDEHYIDDDRVGAKINSAAVRAAMQHSYQSQGGGFHVHLHDHRGRPSPSSTDKRGLPGVVDSLANVSPDQANGYLILSKDSVYGAVNAPNTSGLLQPKSVSIIGKPLRFTLTERKGVKSNVYDRQSFLGDNAQFLFDNVRVGIVGYGGGGSHIGLQLAHLGVKNILVFDSDVVEDSNLNRLVGAWASDAKDKTLKTGVARRVIKKVLPSANVVRVNNRWQESPELLQSCDIVVGCVDSYAERQQLEAECRRYLIPYIDIGMDVHKVEEEPYALSGQVIISMPGGPCLSCFSFLTEKKLAQEAAKYGKVGGRPQVVWPNGILASTAVGMFVNILTNWTGDERVPTYLSYDGNTGIIQEHMRAKFIPSECVHFPLKNVGTPVFVKL